MTAVLLSRFEPGLSAFCRVSGVRLCSFPFFRGMFASEGRLVDKRFIRETFACASATTDVYKMLVIIIS
jgi:hypothetical protein